ncbi:hypothetical protein GWK08_15910 [Leptobacterium flavescens]|uniref:Uncharacterized protein n=1 Tax=Leptobacterium flavescens TaxID=472055 RepID=A0A6P0UQY3_9FLAO|nr:hypothetical protein [Leptobacterium flavescens]NER14942.1 hypothetical protein [Leptobacterium flavescens]
MRFFKLKNNFNWKYIIGEVLLIFIGINLAIWFNNWNTSKKSMQDKEVIIAKIREEIENNKSELEFADKSYHLVTEAFSEYTKIYEGTSSRVLASPEEFNMLQKKYPGFFTHTDSTKTTDKKYLYLGGTHIELELPVLNKIAWDTTKSINITNEFDYECLYDLESMYNLQDRVLNEVNKAAEALQKGKMKELMSVLRFLHQLDLQLIDRYNDVLKNINSCR